MGQLKKYEEAIREFNAVIKLNDGNFSNARFNKGLALYNLNKHEDAILEFDEVIKLNDDNFSPARFNKGLALYNLNKYDEAIEEFDEIIKLKNEDLSDSLFQKGNILSDLKKYDEAIQQFDEVIKLNDKNNVSLAHWNKAIALGKLYKYNEERKELLQVIKLDPNSEDAYYEYWKITYVNETEKEVKKEFINNLKSNKNFLSYLYTAYAVMTDNEFEEAITYYQKAIELDKNSARGYYELGDAYLQMLLYNKAEEQYDKALQKDPCYVQAQHNKASIYEKKGNYKQAYHEWQKAAKLYEEKLKDDKNAEDFNYHFYYAEILYYSLESDDFAKIENLYFKALKILPENSGIHLALVKFYSDQKEKLETATSENEIERRRYMHGQLIEHYKIGTNILKKIIENNPNKLDLTVLGEFDLLLNNHDEATDNFKKALSYDSTLLQAYIGLGVAQVKNENYRDAIKNFKKAIEFDPDDLNLRCNLGDAYRKAEMHEEAQAIYRKITAVVPVYLDALIGLGECSKTLGDKSFENKEFNKAEEYYSFSKTQFDKTLELNLGIASKKLSKNELSALYYSRGYIKVKLSEIAPGLRIDYFSLQNAEYDFSKITESQPEYFKAQKALKKIREKRYSFFSFRKKAPLVVFLLALITFGGVQYIFFFNRFDKKDQYSINKKNLTDLLKKKNLDSLSTKFTPIQAETFESFNTIEAILEDIIPANILSQIGTTSLIDHKKVKDHENLSEVGYGFFVFGSLVFMVVGLFLTEITRLKFGSIEMDKTSIDNVSTSQKLDISK